MLNRVKSTLGFTVDRISETSDAWSNALTPYKPPAPNASVQNYDEPHGIASKAIHDLRLQLKKGLPLLDIKTVIGIIDALRHGNEIDDRKLLLENALMLMSRLPDGSSLKSKLQAGVVELLWHDLSHPPATYLGKQHIWRTPDGSYNNVNFPDMGKAGSPYSRSVQQITPLPPSQLPDPGLLFDSLLKREKYVEHPAGLSAMMFSFATLVIHTVFRTSPQNWSINQTSSYVDLAPLYGWNAETSEMIRVAKEQRGRGFLKPDTFAEDRLLFLPPAAAAVLVLLNRNHNYIAAQLLEHNEKGTFNKDLSKLTTEQLLAQDDELFNVARLINCAWFGMIIFSDYFSAILGLCRYGSSWWLNPFDEIRKADHTLVERGVGNAVTVEFNLLYRWHATLSQMDVEWLSKVFDRVFGGKPYEDLDMKDYIGAMQALKAAHGADPSSWRIAGLERGTDGKFKDSDLARLIFDATAHPASSFGARNTPGILRIVEIMTIKQSRTWGVCSLNEFRKYLGLKPYKSFEEWNPRPEIWQTAKRIYGDIDKLELHVGLQAEDVKPFVPGAGLCPGYTVSRAILADAIALTRGDRFFTTDFTPYNLTSWGYMDCQREDNNPAFGGMLGRLFLRTLPNEFTHNSAYTWFPLMTPASMKQYLTTMDLADRYDFSRPTNEQPIQPITRHSLITGVLKSSEFSTTYAERAKVLGLEKSFFIASSDIKGAQELHNKVKNIFFPSTEALKKATSDMVEITLNLIRERSFTIVGKDTLSVDIVRDVLNLMPIHWIAKVTGLDLKTKENPRGSFVEIELMQMFQEIYEYIFLEGDTAHQLQLELQVKQHTDQLLRSIRGTADNPKSGIFGTLFGTNNAKSVKTDVLGKLYGNGYEEKDVASILFAVAVGVTAEYSQALVHVINLYFEPKHAAEFKTLKDLAARGDIETVELFEGYVREALRLDPPVPGVHRGAPNDVAVDGTQFTAGGRYYLSIATANLDPVVFPEPTKINPNRPAESYLIGDTALRALGEDFVIRPIAAILKAIFSLPNIRRGPGVSGILNRTEHILYNTTQYDYMDRKLRTKIWSQSMIFQYELNHPTNGKTP